MNLLGFDQGLGLVRIAGCAELFPPRSLVATCARPMITVTRVSTGEALIFAPFSDIGTLDGAPFADAPSCLAYVAWVLAQRPPGDAIKVMIAAGDLSGQRAVLSTGDGTVAYASALDASHRNAVLGLTIAAASAGAMVDVATSGPVASPGWGLTPGLPLFLGEDGLITQTPPSSPAAFALRLGHAAEPDTAVIRIGPPITLLT
ncbi:MULTISPECIES: hypothetical protein [unclassified Methylobacterium]|uniref:hypothetical protein n=1 Tax=unclassified Methylobacterium TaxID=2615210 RepID=UPI00226A100A|nr:MULTISPECIES: hypothetical protein [unclassified Methylobacterium]